MERRSSELQVPRPLGQNVIIENKKLVRVSGVIEVESFHEDEAQLVTTEGSLGVFGSSLHLARLNPEEGLAVIDGNIIAIEYAPETPERRGLFSKTKR